MLWLKNSEPCGGYIVILTYGSDSKGRQVSVAAGVLQKKGGSSSTPVSQ